MGKEEDGFLLYRKERRHNAFAEVERREGVQQYISLFIMIKTYSLLNALKIKSFSKLQGVLNH